MNKKTIILRLDWTSKIILFLLSVGIWLIAVKPLAPNQAHAETTTSKEPNNTEKLLGKICDHLKAIEDDLSSQLSLVTTQLNTNTTNQENILNDLKNMFKRDHSATEALLKRLDEITANQSNQLESIKDCDKGIKSIRGFQGSGTRSW